ncbi:MAG: tetratricopeptide repeat protein [Chloroflexi bacterium]|nr:tetratricopeptide repeat protein [Chloroflexota bacterium]
MRQGKYFTQQIQQLATEIGFALQWQGPIILLAIYRSSHVLDDAEASLAAQLTPLEQDLASIHVRSDSFNIAEIIAETDRENKVFSIADLDQGGGENHADAYRSLNLHREYFIEENIRCVFWVTEREAQQLSLIAPDFWAFRHRVIDLVGHRATPNRSASFQGLVWTEWPWHVFKNDTKTALTYRKQLLEKLPDKPETALMRINLYAEIAGLHVQEENWAQALEAVKRGLDSMPAVTLPELEARLLVCLAIILLQMEHYSQAHAALQKAVLLAPDHDDVLTLLAQVNRLEGRRSEALAYIKKAIRLQPERAASWNECGNIYADLGRIAQALDAYQKAFDIFPEHVVPLINKSAVLASTNRLNEAQEVLALVPANKMVNLRRIAKRRGFEFLAEIK